MIIESSKFTVFSHFYQASVHAIAFLTEVGSLLVLDDYFYLNFSSILSEISACFRADLIEWWWSQNLTN